MIEWIRRYRERRRIIIAALKDVMLDCVAWPGTPQVSDIQIAISLKHRLAQQGIVLDLNMGLIEVECLRRKQRRRKQQLERQYRKRRGKAVRR